MRRFISFRDFDWLLLSLVLLLSVISIFEIYSATLHTKFVGFETKQIFWLIGGLAAMFVFSLIGAGSSFRAASTSSPPSG
jgi:rod shape determining protein RodA